jgi:hypothetical protein
MYRFFEKSLIDDLILVFITAINLKIRIYTTIILVIGFGLVIGFIELVTTGNYSAIAISHTLQFTIINI